MSTKEKPGAGGTGLSENDDLNGCEDNLRRVQRQAVPVHVGEIFVGFLVSLPAGYEAITSSGSHLGRFNSELAAATALAAPFVDLCATCGW
jgi:hypothetical protein